MQLVNWGLITQFYNWAAIAIVAILLIMGAHIIFGLS